MKRVVITGGLGFIGTRLASRLLDRGIEVTLIDSLSVQIHGAVPHITPPEGATVERLDVRDLHARADLLDGADYVFHLAAETGTGQSMYQIRRYVEVNELGTASLLEAVAACRTKPKAMVLASSRAVYGEGAYRTSSGGDQIAYPSPRSREQLAACQWEHIHSDGSRLIPVATAESSRTVPGSVYAATKLSQEHLFNAACQAIGSRCVVLRFQNVYGEGQSLMNPYTGIISIFFNRARQGLPIHVFEDGLESRDFVHVDDVATALARSVEVDLPPAAVINVGSGVATSVLTLASELLKQSRMNVPVTVTGEFRVGDIRHCYADISKLKSLLGLEPTVSLSAGLERFCRWANSQPAYEDRSSVAQRELKNRGLTN